MRRIVLLVALSTLAGCTGMQQRMQASRECQETIGPRPYAAADNFGLVGAAIAESQPERQAWDEAYHFCMKATLHD